MRIDTRPITWSAGSSAVEQLAFNQLVEGSIPSLRTTFKVAFKLLVRFRTRAYEVLRMTVQHDLRRILNGGWRGGSGFAPSRHRARESLLPIGLKLSTEPVGAGSLAGRSKDTGNQSHLPHRDRRTHARLW